MVLARKYRPRRFSEMVGQEHVVRALSNALASGRLHHAYLFTGTRGIGKTTVSRILAKSLNCTGPDGLGGVTAEPCGQCQACTEIDADRYIDYIELDAASNRGIDEARELIERAAYKPSVGRFKVFMIDEAHQLTKDAFSALLKTLEEPPEYLKFVLATTDPDKMLPTVLSRCLQFNLRPMAPQTVHEHLAHVLAVEQVAHDAGSLRLLARAARGSMRDALSLTDQAIAYGGGRLDEAAVRAHARQRRALGGGGFRAGAGRPRWRGRAGRGGRRAPARAVGRRRARGAGHAAAADGDRAGRARCAGRRGSRHAGGRALESAVAGRRIAIALQHRRAWPRRVAVGERRVRGTDDGVAALPGIPRGAAGCGGDAARAGVERAPAGAAAAVETAAKKAATVRSDEPPPWVDCRAR